MRQTVVPGVWSWSRWQPDRDLDFNSFFIENADGNLVVDPLDPDAETLEALRTRGVAAVLVTNRDHERASAAVAEATGAPVIASALDAPSLARSPERTVAPGDVLYGWTVLGFEGLKTPGEIALVDAKRHAGIVGDALWGKPAGALMIMPKVADLPRAALSLRALRARRLKHLLVGDGACIFGNAFAAIGAALDVHDGVFTNRVNLDELTFVPYSAAGTSFADESAEIGWLLGAERLGYAAARLRRGQHYCPYHWHGSQEELFVVMAGAPSVRTPRGTFTLRAGDVVAFPVSEIGAHRLFNDGEEDALVLLIANSDRADLCFYPDSGKVMLGDPGPVVADRPERDYFEGES